MQKQKKNFVVETVTTDTITDTQHAKLITLCEDAYYLKEPAHANYDVSDWQSKPHTLLNLLYFWAIIKASTGFYLD